METQIYWLLNDKYSAVKEKLTELSREHLEAVIIDSKYNDFLSDKANFSASENKSDHGKRIPYIGWWWRHIQFSNLKQIPIGDCGGFIGFMANNKWDYPERYLTESEALEVISIIDSAMLENRKGGCLADIIAATDKELARLWDYLQSLDINEAQDD